MTPSVQQAFREEIGNLRTLLGVHYETADDTTANSLEFAARLVERAQTAVETADSGAVWLQLTGAIDFLSSSGFAPADLGRIRARIDSLL